MLTSAPAQEKMEEKMEEVIEKENKLNDPNGETCHLRAQRPDLICGLCPATRVELVITPSLFSILNEIL